MIVSIEPREIESEIAVTNEEIDDINYGLMG